MKVRMPVTLAVVMAAVLTAGLAAVPYVGLFVSDDTIALSPTFTYSGFNQWLWDNPYALNIKPKI
jgi:hypothetical protein